MQPLAGVRVVELATGVAGPYAAKMFADFGADVVKVEPPGGDPSRHAGPFLGDEPDPERSCLFLHLNTNKRSVVADVATPAGAELVKALVRGADVVIESSTPGSMTAAGLDPAALRALNPGAVVTSVTPFGQDGPYAGLPMTELVLYAMAGPMSSTGTAEREPVKLAGDQVTYQAGNVAALATLSALEVARRSGTGIHVDLSCFEAQAASIDRRTTFLLYRQFSGMDAQRAPGQAVSATPAGYYPTEDGYVLVFTIPSWVSRMVEALGDDDLAARYSTPAWMADAALAEDLEAVLYPWLLSRTRAQAAADAQALRWPITPLNNPADLAGDEHFEGRGFFVDVDHPGAGPIRQLGAPFRLTDGWALRRPAPRLDEHGDEVRAEASTEASAEAAAAGPAPAARVSVGEPRLPLAGVRVVDLTVVWAGPAAAMHLADLGAEVIRVDNPFVFPTATRGTLPRPSKELVALSGPLGAYPGLDPGPRPWNRHSMFSAHARNKLGATVDLRQPFGREMFLRLIETADVFVENNSRKVLDNLGIGWDVLHARNPRLVVLRMPPMGLHGPYRDWLGFGASFEALCGMTALRGYADADPTSLTPTFHMDPASGAAGAFAVLCALRRREQAGTGELIEFAQSENMMQHVGEWFVESLTTGRRREALGNRHHRRAPQNLYPCSGADAWVAISVGTDAEWAGLCRAMGEAGAALAADARFADAAGRRAHHDAIDGAISAWTSQLSPRAVFDRCRAEGVPAGPLMHEGECLDDPHLRARGFFRPNGSADLGTFEFPRHGWTWDGPQMRWGPLCMLGADNEYVWREVVGASDADWAALKQGGHLSLDYLGPDGTPL